MTTQTLPEIATWAAETAAQAADGVEELALSRQALEDAHARYRIARAAVAEFKVNLKGKLLAGMEAKQFISVYEPVLATFDQCLDKLRPYLEKHQNKYGEDELSRTLKTIESDLSDIRELLAKHLVAAQRPIPPIDAESLERGRADVAAGRVEDSRDILKRLQAGEEV